MSKKLAENDDLTEEMTVTYQGRYRRITYTYIQYPSGEPAESHAHPYVRRTYRAITCRYTPPKERRCDVVYWRQDPAPRRIRCVKHSDHTGAHNA